MVALIADAMIPGTKMTARTGGSSSRRREPSGVNAMPRPTTMSKPPPRKPNGTQLLPPDGSAVMSGAAVVAGSTVVAAAARTRSPGPAWRSRVAAVVELGGSTPTGSTWS